MSAYKPSLIEKETIILFNEAESEAEIYTYNRKLINRLKKHPAVAKLKRKDDSGAYTFIVPKKELRIKLKRVVSAVEHEKLKLAAERARKGKSFKDDE